jgi:hypothetical protein
VINALALEKFNRYPDHDDQVAPTMLGNTIRPAGCGAGGVGAASSYYAAVKATDAWSASVKAMVDIGRIPLADALGLQIPAKLSEERDMWQRVGWLLGFTYKPEAGTELDPYRKRLPEDP